MEEMQLAKAEAREAVEKAMEALSADQIAKKNESHRNPPF